MRFNQSDASSILSELCQERHETMATNNTIILSRDHPTDLRVEPPGHCECGMELGDTVVEQGDVGESSFRSRL